MKKIISIVLLLSLCLGLFAGCTPTVEPQQPASNLENAKSLVFNTYKPANKDEIPYKSVDFEVMTSVLVDGETFPVAWTVEVTEGPAEAVQIVDGSSEAFKKVDLTEKPEVDVKFTLTATISDAEGNTATVSFKYQTPKFEAPSADKVVIKFPKDNKYATGTEYKYTSSSGSVKMELVLSDAKADAIAFTMIEGENGYITFKTDDGYYLYADGTNVQFATEESDNTKFVLEVADGGYFIKCAIANYNGKAQYLEVYSGYLTCYGMGSDASIYTFALEAADGANGKVTKYTDGGSTEEPTTPPATEPVTPPSAEGVVEAPVAGTAYKFGMVQGNDGNKLYYLAGGMSSYYMATTTDAAAAIDVYLEETTGGYYLYAMIDGAKTYINMVTSVDAADATKIHVNGKYDSVASTVYTYDAALKTVKTTINDAEYIFGTRNDKTYNTVGPVKAETSPFTCMFYISTGSSEPTVPDVTEPEVTEPAATDKVVLTDTALGLGAYAAGSATVGGVKFGFTELGTYGNGIQMRIKDGRVASLWNETAFAAPISKIELVYNSAKSTYDNADAFDFDFGAAADALNANVKLSTVKGQATYTVTPDAETYTYFKMTLKLTYSFYWDSITIYLADGTVVPGTPSEPEATEPAPTEPEATEPEATQPEATEPTTGEKTTASVTIEAYKAANGWTNGTLYADLVVDSNISVSTSGTPVGNYGLNTGKYYDSGYEWRIYQNESPAITVKAAEGKTIVSVKITYNVKNTGVLTHGTTNITSGTVVDVNANSVTFSVGNTGTATNGQVKITAIEVIYA